MVWNFWDKALGWVVAHIFLMAWWFIGPLILVVALVKAGRWPNKTVHETPPEIPAARVLHT